MHIEHAYRAKKVALMLLKIDQNIHSNAVAQSSYVLDTYHRALFSTPALWHHATGQPEGGGRQSFWDFGGQTAIFPLAPQHHGTVCPRGVFGALSSLNRACGMLMASVGVNCSQNGVAIAENRGWAHALWPAVVAVGASRVFGALSS